MPTLTPTLVRAGYWDSGVTWINYATPYLGSRHPATYAGFEGLDAVTSATFITNATLTLGALSGVVDVAVVAGPATDPPPNSGHSTMPRTPGTQTGVSLAGGATVDVTAQVVAARSTGTWVSGSVLGVIFDRVSGTGSFTATLTIEYVTTQYLDPASPVDAHARVGQVESVEFAVNPQPVVARAEVGVPQVIAPKALYTNPIIARARVNVPASFKGSGTAPALDVAGVLTAQAEVLTPTLSRTLPPEPPPIPWERLIEDPLYHEALKSKTLTLDARADVINESGAIVAQFGIARPGLESSRSHAGMLEASVECNGDSSIRWTCDIRFDNLDLLPTSSGDLLHPLSHNRIRLWQRVLLSDGRWGEIPVGTYYPDLTPHVDEGDVVAVRFMGSDAVAEIKRAKWNTSINLDGATISQAIIAILKDRARWVGYAVTPTTQKVPAGFEAGEPGQDPWKDIEDLAAAAGMIAYADRMGVIRVEPRPTLGSPRASFEEGVDTSLMGLPSIEVDKDSMYNHVTVVSANPDIDPPVIGRAIDDDPSSPLGRAYLEGHIYSHRVENAIITTEEAATTMARNILADSTPVQTVTAVVIPHLHLNPFDTVVLSRARVAVVGAHTLEKWSADLHPDNPLQTITVTSRKEDW